MEFINLVSAGTSLRLLRPRIGGDEVDDGMFDHSRPSFIAAMSFGNCSSAVKVFSKIVISWNLLSIGQGSRSSSLLLYEIQNSL